MEQACNEWQEQPAWHALSYACMHAFVNKAWHCISIQPVSGRTGFTNFLASLVTLPSLVFHRTGLGRALIERLTAKLVNDGIPTITLVSAEDMRQTLRFMGSAISVRSICVCNKTFRKQAWKCHWSLHAVPLPILICYVIMAVGTLLLLPTAATTSVLPAATTAAALIVGLVFAGRNASFYAPMNGVSWRRLSKERAPSGDREERGGGKTMSSGPLHSQPLIHQAVSKEVKFHDHAPTHAVKLLLLNIQVTQSPRRAKTKFCAVLYFIFDNTHVW
eukprot:1160908-Pelagomonas_calceolata.AAC.16